jgi:glycerate dehydrogenase
MPRIVVLDGHTVNPGDLGWERLSALGDLTVHERTPSELVVERARGAEVLVTNKTSLGASVLAQLPGLAGISVLATGFDIVAARAARERGVVVCNVPAYSTASVAQHTFALLLELVSHVGLHASAVRAGEWARSVDFSFWHQPIRELDGQVLGIVGLGTIGRRVAVIGQALGMRVLATSSRRPDPPPPGVTVTHVDVLFREADVVSLHCPLTESTRGLVRRERLVAMKNDALLVNTARGALIDETDLAWALEAGVIAGAALDVLCEEPPPPEHPLLSAPRCIVTPHQAWTSRAARERLLTVTAENVAGILSGRPQNVVNG